MAIAIGLAIDTNRDTWKKRSRNDDFRIAQQKRASKQMKNLAYKVKCLNKPTLANDNFALF